MGTWRIVVILGAGYVYSVVALAYESLGPSCKVRYVGGGGGGGRERELSYRWGY